MFLASAGWGLFYVYISAVVGAEAQHMGPGWEKIKKTKIFKNCVSLYLQLRDIKCSSILIFID